MTDAVETRSKSGTDEPRKPQEGRDERGRFAPGNPWGGPRPGQGRPPREAVLKVRAALENAVGNGSLEKWAKAVRKQIEDGDLKAAEFLFDRIIGKPAQVVDILADVSVKLYESVSPDDWPAADDTITTD